MFKSYIFHPPPTLVKFSKKLHLSPATKNGHPRSGFPAQDLVSGSGPEITSHILSLGLTLRKFFQKLHLSPSGPYQT